MKVVSLFSGAGGLDLGFLLAGFEIVWANEFDKHAVESYRKNVAPHVVCRDIREVGAGEIPDADIVIGGVPCQAWSVAGKRLGAADGRNLWPEFIRVVREKRPAWFLAENVPGLLSWGGGSYFCQLVAEFRGLGYAVQHAVLDAADYGVPQRRRRVFIVGNHTGRSFTWPEPTHAGPGKAEQMRLFGPPLRPWVTVREALGISFDGPSLPVTATEAKGATPGGNNRASDILLWVDDVPHDGEPRVFDVTCTPAPCVDARQGGRPRLIVASKRKRSGREVDAPSVTVAADGREALVLASPAQTIDHTGELHRPGRHDVPGSWGKAATRVRRLTVRECARLQSFPDWFEVCGPKTRQYMQVGNAVPVLLAWHLANAVRRAEGLPVRPVPDVLDFIRGDCAWS